MRVIFIRAGVGALLWSCVVQVGPARAADPFYRCTEPDGTVVFSDTPCGRNATAFEQPHAPRVGTRLVDPAAVFPREAPSDKRRRSGSKSAKRSPEQQEYNCRKKERRLDTVNARLRHGYKRAEGERLRRQRVELEDYIDTYCD